MKFSPNTTSIADLNFRISSCVNSVPPYTLLKMVRISASEQLMSGRNITREVELPETFLRYDYDRGPLFYPMPQGVPESLAYRQLLRLKAETAFKLHLHSEVKAISARLGGRYKHIEKLINKGNDNDNL